MLNAEFWRKRKKDFAKLATEEYSFLPDPADNRRLRADGDYTDQHAAGIGGIGSWRLNAGPSADFLARFEETATWAGSVLGPPQGVKPIQFWLHRLFEDLLETEGPRDEIGHLAIGQRDQGGIIRDVCQASSTFCSRLATRSMEREVEAPRPQPRSDETRDREADANDPGTGRRANKNESQIIAERAANRQKVVLPILSKKRWKRGKLATQAAVSRNSVYQYLDGTRETITPENRKALADALGLPPDQLPD
jgi:hypothetical protein